MSSIFERLSGLLTVAILLVAFGATPSKAADEQLPLVAWYQMKQDPANPNKLVDSGPLHCDSTLNKPQFVAGRDANTSAVRLESGKVLADLNDPRINRLLSSFSYTAWVKVDSYPAQDNVNVGKLIWKGYNEGGQFSVSRSGQLFFHGSYGSGWYDGPWGGNVPLNQWTHIALTFQKGGKVRAYINGAQVFSGDVKFPLFPIGDPYRIGGGQWNGELGDVRFYASELTAEQIRQEANGETLPTRAATDADIPESGYPVSLALVRFDMPYGLRDGWGRTRQTAKRVAGPDAVDWPTITLNGKPIFHENGDDNAEVYYARNGKNYPLFQQSYDPVIMPGNHWFRALEWLWNRSFVYTTDRAARANHEYELWTFPVIIRGKGDADVKDVVLTVGGTEIYRTAGPLHSLTLLLPQNEPGKPYELSVAGRGPVRFDMGLQPVTLGDPHDRQMALDQTMPGNGPTITVQSVTHLETFPNQKEWTNDVKAMATSAPTALPAPAVPSPSFAGKLGISVPRSPLTVYVANFPHGMSGGGGFVFGNAHIDTPPFTSYDDYAAYLAATGYDAVFEGPGDYDNDQMRHNVEQWVTALGKQGVRCGLELGSAWGRPFLAHPNVSLFSYTLSDFHAPLYRDVQIASQRLSRYPNFLGIGFSADNAGYVSYWDWAPPIPDRPWGEAFAILQGDRPKVVPQPNSMAKKDFVDYLHRNDEAFKQYGYFGRAIKELNNGQIIMHNSFGSSPGVGGRGGWPWASIPGKAVESDMPVQQAYDWNELYSSLPMHIAALLDRLRADNPQKPTWAMVDDFDLLFDKMTRERAYALALTRGVQGIGTNFLAKPSPFSQATIDDQRALYQWMHQYGGVYAMSEPQPVIGILYVHEQAQMRTIVRDDDVKNQLQGSHEGKTTEALFLCHAAGLPAAIITPDALLRGVPSSMKAILLVGLNNFDDSWHWYDGLTDKLQAFVNGGGRILLDNESACPVTAVKTGMPVMAYVNQRDIDCTPNLLARNADNITKLRAAMADVHVPVATSSDPTLWAVPTLAGDTQYLTVVNQQMGEVGTRHPIWTATGTSPFRPLIPRTGTIDWQTNRPIYDVRAHRLLTPAEAKTVDLTQHAFQYYALPPAPVKTPTVKIARDAQGMYTATVTISNPTPMRGIPVQLTLTNGADTATVYSATGLTATLPLAATDAPGVYQLTVTELLSGLSAQSTITVAPAAAPSKAAGAVQVIRAADLAYFAGRKNVPLVVALTPEQQADPSVKALAERLVTYYTAKGRKVSVESLEPSAVVLGLRTVRSSSAARYPQWSTEEADLLLLGSPANNLLLFDEERGYLLPDGARTLPAGQAQIACVYSPFVGEYHALNLLATDTAGLTAAVNQLTAK